MFQMFQLMLISEYISIIYLFLIQLFFQMASSLFFHLSSFIFVPAFLFIYLFGVLHCFQHCTGHITTGSWGGRGNQYIQFVRVLYCKLPTNSKQLPAFLLKGPDGDRTPASEVGGESVTTLPPWPLSLLSYNLKKESFLR